MIFNDFPQWESVPSEFQLFKLNISNLNQTVNTSAVLIALIGFETYAPFVFAFVLLCRFFFLRQLLSFKTRLHKILLKQLATFTLFLRTVHGHWFTTEFPNVYFESEANRFN